MNELFLSALLVLVEAVVAFAKKLKFPKDFLPELSLVLGFLGALLYLLTVGEFNVFAFVLLGLALGGTPVAGYEVVKNVKERIKK